MVNAIPFRESQYPHLGITIAVMDAKTNRTAWMRTHVEAAGGPAAWLSRFGAGRKWSTAQVSQWTSDKPKPIGHALARALEEAQGLAPGSMDLPPGIQSQNVQLDLDTLGVALTAIDKALRDVEIQGKLGTLAESVQWAYRRAATMLKDPSDPAQRHMFDEMVAMHLGSWDGRSGAAEASTGKDRTAEAARTEDGDRGRARRDSVRSR